MRSRGHFCSPPRTRAAGIRAGAVSGNRWLSHLGSFRPLLAGYSLGARDDQYPSNLRSQCDSGWSEDLLSRSRVEVPQLALDILAEWRKQTIYGRDNDYVLGAALLDFAIP